MSGLGAGLARGLAAYGQGRMIADERDYRRAQDAAALERQRQQDAAAAAREARMMEQMTASMKRTEKLDKIDEEERNNKYRMDGFRPVDEAQATGQALGAGAGLASLGGPLGAAGGALAQYGQAMQDGAKRPDATVGGRGMVKTGESLVERVQRLQDQRREGERLQAQQFTLDRDKQNNQQATERDDRNFERQKALRAPAAPRDPKFITGNDGNMYRFDEKAGGLVPVPVIGQQPTAPRGDDMRPTSVQAMPGDNLLRGIGAPQQPRAATQYSGGQATPSPYGGGGLFGKQKAAPPKYIEQVGTLDTMDQLLDQYKDALSKVDVSLMQGQSPNMADANAAYQQLILVAKEAANLGVLNGPDLQILQNTITPPVGATAAWRGKESILKTIERAKSTNQVKRNTLNKVYGQFPSQNTAPATRDELDDLASQFERRNP